MIAPKAQPAAPSLLARHRPSTMRGEFVELPMLGRVWVELVGGDVLDEIDSAVFSRMKALDLPLAPVNMRTLEGIRDRMTLAWAVRDPDHVEVRAGSKEEWGALDIDLVTACAIVYRDVRERLSPVQLGELTREQMDDIRRGIEKKNPMPLLDAGVVVLTRYLLTTADPLASSPTMPSSTGESP